MHGRCGGGDLQRCFFSTWAGCIGEDSIGEDSIDEGSGELYSDVLASNRCARHRTTCTRMAQTFDMLWQRM